MKFRNLLLIALFAAPFAFGQLFTRVAELPLPALENAGFGNMVAGVDFDGDGYTEIYLVNNNWADFGQELIPTIYAYEFDGSAFSLVWQATLAPGIVLQNTWPALTSGDLDKDGRPEIIWGRVNYSGSPSNDPRVIVYEYAGDGSNNLGVPDLSNPGNWLPNSKWAIDTAAGVNLRPFRWFVADPDGDGTNELLFSTRAGTYSFGVASVSDIPNNGDGSETWTLEYSGGPATSGDSNAGYDLAVLDNKAFLILANGNVWPFNYSGGVWNSLPAQTGLALGGSWASSCVVDIDNNATKEIVVGTYFTTGSQNVYLLQQSGDTLTSSIIANMTSLISSTGRFYSGAAGDIDLNGKMDFVFGSRAAVPNAAITRLEYQSGDISLPASYTASIIDQGYVPPGGGTGRWMYLAIAEVDGDANNEVLYGDGTGELAPIIVLDVDGNLPVELKSFSASVSDGFVNLNWSTATETNNRGFEIQRKANGNDFVAIGFVQGKGTTTQIQSYSFVDNNVQAGKYQYRLKQIDLDGSYSISSIVEVSILSPIEFSLAQNYPNPFNPSTTINFSLAKESNVNLKVFDLLGQEIISLVNNEFMTAGSYSYKFDASTLASGTYIYRLEAGDFVQTKKMTLTK